MAVSKRTRYEVLRRDGHRCRYCGSHADDSPLTVDHVTPKSLGGSDSPSNLVAACKDCNAGKASANPDSEHVAKVADDAVRWAMAMKKASDDAAEVREKKYAVVEPFLDAWYALGLAGSPMPPGWESSVVRWLDIGLTMDDLIELVAVTSSKKIKEQGRFSYFAGCCWNVVRERQETAEKIVKGEGYDAYDHGYHAGEVAAYTAREHLRMDLGEVEGDYEQTYSNGFNDAVYATGHSDAAMGIYQACQSFVDGVARALSENERLDRDLWADALDLFHNLPGWLKPTVFAAMRIIGKTGESAADLQETGGVVR